MKTDDKGNGLYLCDFKQYTNPRRYLTTVEQNEQLYTKREVEKAKIANDLLKRLGYISASELIKMIRAGTLLNCVESRCILTTYSECV